MVEAAKQIDSTFITGMGTGDQAMVAPGELSTGEEITHS